MKVNFILTGEGSSDLRLVEHIQALLIECGFEEVSGEAPDLSLFSKESSRSIRGKLQIITANYPCVDVIFVHRDADGCGTQSRQEEIKKACIGLIKDDKIIPIIPVTMLETWLLTDQENIKRVAGNLRFQGPIKCIPTFRRLEDVKDAKKLLLDALCEVSEAEGSRLTKFKKRFPEMRARLTFDLNHNGPVSHLPSYSLFRSSVEEYAKNQLAKPRNEPR